MVANVMLAVHCKKTDPVDLKKPIWQFIASTYGEMLANDANDDLATTQSLRADVVSMAAALPSLKDTLTRYYRAVSLMETRFPVSREKDCVKLSFTWYDAFRPTKRAEQYSWGLEKASVLFNIGAVLSQMALACDMTTDQGMKEAARRFQEAAGVFGHLRDVVGLKVEAPRPVDLSPECAGLLERLMLAQAQECTFEKARTDKKGANLLARLARQVSVFYTEVDRALQQPTAAQHFDRSWVLHVNAKSALYNAEALHQAAIGQRENEEIAQEIARLKEARRILEAAKRDVKFCGKELQEAHRAADEVLAIGLAKAERENATVYLQRVPAAIDLPVIVPAPLVKALPPAGELDASAEGLFTGLVPDTSAKALSKYTDMVDTLIREQMDKLDAASDEARLRLREWELPEALQALDAGSSAALPDGLRAELEELEDHGGVRHLQEIAAQVKELRRVAEEELGKVAAQLEAEARDDGRLREQHPGRWQRPASAALNSTMREKIAGYRANLAAAAESDGRLEQRLAANAAAFGALSIDAAVSQMPRLQAPMVTVGDLNPAGVVTTLRNSLESLNALSAERASLEEALKVEKGKDNILPKLMATADHPDALFAAELKKYEPLRERVDANVAKQAQLLAVLARSQGEYRSVFGYQEWRQACENAAAGMRGRLGGYKEVRDNLAEGLRFYMSLQEAIRSLGQQVGDYCLTRNMQRDDMLEDLSRRTGESQRKEEADRQAAAARQHLQNMTLNRPSGPTAPPAPQAYPPPYQPPQPTQQHQQQHLPQQQQHQQSPYGPPPGGASGQAPSAPPQQPQPGQPPYPQGGGFPPPPQWVAPPPQYGPGSYYQPHPTPPNYGQPPPYQPPNYGGYQGGYYQGQQGYGQPPPYGGQAPQQQYAPPQQNPAASAPQQQQGQGGSQGGNAGSTQSNPLWGN